MNIKYSSSDTGCRENQLILMGLFGWEDQRTVTEWQTKQQYEPDPDWKKPPKRKSGGIIGAIKALITKRRPENKCPTCGATNPKESYACTECGTPFTSRQVKE